MHTGSCLCGAVRFFFDGPLGEVDACHCTQCRKQSGHYFASANVARERWRIEGDEHVTWYRSSEKVRRGFCATCGSFLFWDPLEKDWTSIAMGALDAPTGAALAIQIHVASKGDYYEIADGLPQRAD
jgi:hypothetical protein